MDMQSRGIGIKTFVALFSLVLFVGVLGGGATAGALTYYFEQQLSTPATAGATSSPQAVTVAAPRTQLLQLEQDNAIVDAVKKANPAVVTIVNTLQPQRVRSPFGQRTQQGQAVGTGVIIDSKGYIVTNNHVIEGAQSLEVLFDNGDKAAATVVGADAANDLAVIQVTGKTMPAVAQFGDSTTLQVGEPVIAIGAALGDFQDTVTVGVVSALNRRVDASANQSLQGLIQTDAAINHGNSGGPLLNADGQVIGINTLVVRSDPAGDVAEGLGFAIPSSTVKQVVSQLISGT